MAEKLTGAKLFEDIKANPDKYGISRTVGAPVSERPVEVDRGFLGNLGMNITKPFRTGVDIIGSALGAQGPLLSTQSEYYDIVNDPFKAGVKSAAGIGSFAVPVGAGVSGLARSGAISGTL